MISRQQFCILICALFFKANALEIDNYISNSHGNNSTQFLSNEPRKFDVASLLLNAAETATKMLAINLLNAVGRYHEALNNMMNATSILIAVYMLNGFCYDLKLTNLAITKAKLEKALQAITPPPSQEQLKAILAKTNEITFEQELMKY